jgi:hypothetical protein
MNLLLPQEVLADNLEVKEVPLGNDWGNNFVSLITLKIWKPVISSYVFIQFCFKP